MTDWLKKNHSLLFRMFMFVIYVWFGVLKLFDISPAKQFVADSIPYVDDHLFFLVLGVVEVLIGIAFLFPKLTNITFWIFLFHMLGTFLPFMTIPEQTFTAFPYGLTMEGQYIVKNLALIGLGGVIWLDYQKERG